MDLRGKMEFYFRVVGPFRIQKPFTLSQVYEISILVFGYIGMFEPGKILQFFGVVARDPAGLVKRLGIELNGSAILMQEPVLDHFELQLPDTADDLLVATILGEQLGDPLIGQL